MSKTPRYGAAVGWLWLIASLGSAQTLKDPALRMLEIVGGLNAPTAMAFIGADDLLVLQKNDGQVRRVLHGVLQPTPVLDVAVDQTSERGLLGIAAHPAFPSAPWVYLYYTESGTATDTSGSPAPLGNRLYRYRWDGNALVEPALLLHLPVTPGPNHDGGALTFGPDGTLYVVIGDLNRRGQLQNVPTGPGADDTSVIIRLNDDGTVPSDNPFFALGGNLAKYYAYGIRNGFGLAFDPLTNTLWMTENGPQSYDEINRVAPGFNSGWVQIMGPEARSPQGIDSLFQLPGSHYADPEFSWFDNVAPTAIAFLNSAQLGAPYQNDVFVGDFNFGNLYRFKPTSSRDGLHLETPGLAADLVADPNDDLQEVIFGTGFGGITDLKVGPDGRLYILSFQGKIFAVSQAAELTLRVHQTTFRPGDSLRVDLGVRNSGPALSADIYFGLLLPDGVTVVFFTSLSPLNIVVTGLDADLQTFQPLLRNTFIPQGLDVTYPDIPVYTWQGGEPPGVYAVFAALTPAGAFADSRIDPGDIVAISSQPLSVTLP